MASKQNESTATDETKQSNAVAANSESILGRLVQFLVSPSLTEDFIECLVAAGENTSGFLGRVSRETLRDNVKKYICCRGKMEQYVSLDVRSRYLRPGSSDILDNVCYLVSYLMFKPSSEDELECDFVSLGKEILTECTYLLDNMNMLLALKPPCRTLIGRILHYYKKQ